MIINVREERLLVISDIHLGNWFFAANRSLMKFLQHVSDGGYTLCINGDGLDILQTSLVKMTKELSGVFGYVERLVRAGPRLYYVIGNHDIILEHFIEDFQGVQLTPFLNVASGDRRIRIEHGHLYDPFFVRYPDLYFMVTRWSGLFLKIHPAFYHLHGGWKRAKGAVKRLAAKKEAESLPGLRGEPSHFVRAAREVANRGFDTVIFGHTHFHGSVDLGGGKTYINTGSWLHRPHYVKIENGTVELLPWNG
jgi:UDP-2,3-diacylglucosamine pyrophosphatase LpxH